MFGAALCLYVFLRRFESIVIWELFWRKNFWKIFNDQNDFLLMAAHKDVTVEMSRIKMIFYLWLLTKMRRLKCNAPQPKTKLPSYNTINNKPINHITPHYAPLPTSVQPSSTLTDDIISDANYGDPATAVATHPRPPS